MRFHRQITFITRSRFCTISKKTPPYSARTIWSCKMLEFQAKLNAKYMLPVLQLYLKFWRYLSCKKLYDTTSPFASCCFTLAFIYISRYDFLQGFRTSFTIIEINIFVTNSPFLIDSLKLVQPLNSQNPLNVTKIFC